MTTQVKSKPTTTPRPRDRREQPLSLPTKPRPWLIRQARQRLREGFYDSGRCIEAAIEAVMRDLSRRRRSAGRDEAA